MPQGSAPRPQLAFFRNLVVRHIRQDYLENVSGFAWLLLQPLMLLGVYAFIFTTVFRARVVDSGDVPFIAWLAVAFWPWTAFSEAVLRASSSITSNAGLIGKVAFATEQLPLAQVTATFLMHLAGYLAVLLVLQLTGTDIQWAYLPLALPLLVLLWVLACGLGLVFSALSVFVRDLAQMLPPLMTFWFFTTPVLYSPSLFPERLSWAMEWNVMTTFVQGLRDLLLFGRLDFAAITLGLALGVFLLAGAALWFFRRLAGHFEDFL